MAGLLILASATFARQALDLEVGYAWPGYLNIRFPGDSGTKFDMTQDLDAEGTPMFRLRYRYEFGDRHEAAILIAPLSVKATGTLDKDVDFDGVMFKKGTRVEGNYRFDSYRLVYRYLLHDSDHWRISAGAALKVRDAAVSLEGGGLDSESDNLGVVPLLSINVTWTPHPAWSLLLDGEALAAPQGRAEDILLACRYQATERLLVQAGYRILEGGADNDDVYTFALFHYAVCGLTWMF